MESIISKLGSLRLKIKKDEEEDRLLKKQIKNALEAVLCLQEAAAGVICDCRINRGTLILKAKNKVFANELFLKKGELLAAFKENKKVKDIVIH